MKALLTATRIIVGVLFIFSGLIKANDPLGLAYKMDEYFAVWHWDWATPYSLYLSIAMNVFEIVAGIAILLGYQAKLFTWLLLLLILFFTFLTGYVLFSGKIRACGCFGDCIPLTPMQTFSKDIALLLLIVILIVGRKYIHPVLKGMAAPGAILVSIFAVTFLQFYVLKHLPITDCLPYKKGNNILELRKMPAGAIPDEYDYIFVYEKNGEKKEFTTSNLPDSTWKFSERKQKLIKQGVNNTPLINDFSLVDSSGVNITDTILSQPGEYYLFFLQNMNEGSNRWAKEFVGLYATAKHQGKPIYIVTSDKEKANDFFNVQNKYNLPILTSDATAIKTAARANPTLFVMKGPIVQDKYSWADIDKVYR